MADELGGSPGSQGDGDDDPFEVVFDEEFVRAATIREPSARARMLASRWRDEPPSDGGSEPPRGRPPGRRGWLRRHLSLPHRRRTGGKGNRTHRRRWVTSLVTTLVLALVAAIGAWRISTLVGGVDGNGSGTPDYFAGTPAAAYASGADGIHIPAAVALTEAPYPTNPQTAPTDGAPAGGAATSGAPTASTPAPSATGSAATPSSPGGSPTPSGPTSTSSVPPSAAPVVSAAKVGAALETTRNLLISANLDPNTLKGNGDTYLATLAAAMGPGPALDTVKAAFNNSAPPVDTAGDPLAYATRFDQTAVSLGTDVRSDCTVVPAATADGRLQVQTDCVFAYVVFPKIHTRDGYTVVLIHRVQTFYYTFTPASDGTPTAHLALSDNNQYAVTPTACTPATGYISPITNSDQPVAPQSVPILPSSAPAQPGFGPPGCQPTTV